MRWKFWQRQPAGPLEGARARERAEEQLEQTMAETPMYAALGDSLREIRERNHLTELFYAIHQGRD